MGSAYAVWISEVMLQQTQVAAVIPYFHRFLARFPDVASLAAADESAVLRVWEGLGYYRRARQLHRAARIIVDQFAGELPNDPIQLAGLPGFGRYTANAVLTFSAHRRLPILEANTRRLWSRLAALEDRADAAAGERALWSLAEAALPKSRPDQMNQALMDLGATICTARSPACGQCPVAEFCSAFAIGNPESFPIVKPKRAKVDVEHVAVVAYADGKVYVVQRSETEVWGGLWEFPRTEIAAGETPAAAAARVLQAHKLGAFRIIEMFGKVRHAIMHYRVVLHGFRSALTSKGRPRAGLHGRWIPLGALEELPLSAPQRRLARSFFLNCVNSKGI